MGWPKGKPRKSKSGLSAIAGKLAGKPGLDASGIEGANVGPAGEIDLGTLAVTDRIAEPAKRERKAAQRTGKERPAQPADLDGATVHKWTDAILQTALSARMLTGIVEAELDAEEAARLANAWANVARWYELPGVAQKSLDWYTAASVTLAIAGPRVIAFRLRRTIERADAKEAAKRAAAARAGVPIVQASPPGPASNPPPASPPPAPATRRGATGASAFRADPDLALGEGDARRHAEGQSSDLRMYAPGGEFH